MRRPLSSIGRGATAAAVLVAALVAGFAAFTVAGVGDSSPPAAQHQTGPPPQPKAVHKTALQRYSEEDSKREGGQPAVAGGPQLAENPPIDPKRFGRPIDEYRRYALGQTGQLAPEVRALEAALRSGDRKRARAAWTVAFARYLNLGAVYGAFGELDQDIDGRAGGLPGGVRDPSFRGLHRLELGLWRGESLKSLVPVARRLEADVAKLPHAIRHDEVTPLDYSLRVHEILEDAQRDFLSGTDVPWSDEGVTATASGVTATEVVLRTLHPFIAGMDQDVPTRAAVKHLHATLDSIAAAHHGTLPPLSELRRSERERLAAALGGALERLQQLPELLATADPTAIPRLH